MGFVLFTYNDWDALHYSCHAIDVMLWFLAVPRQHHIYKTAWTNVLTHEYFWFYKGRFIGKFELRWWQNMRQISCLDDIAIQCYPGSLRVLLLVKTLDGECTLYIYLASFPGIPRLQFLIACSIQKRSQKAWWILPCDPWHSWRHRF